MSPNQSFLLNHVPMEPMSRTYQYRKIMKPLLERKRRARINKCLDELKALLASALQSEGDNVAKLEKADILELTVRHLHNLRQKNALNLRQDRVKTDSFWDGFRQCAAEVSHYLSKYDPKVGAEVMKHINRCAQVDPGRSQRQTISLRSDAYLFGAFRYDNHAMKHAPVVRQESHIPSPPRIVEIIEIDDSVSVWRPW